MSRPVVYPVIEGEDGKLITSPSSSPENTFRTEKGMASSVCEGAEMEKAIVWELLDNTALACAVLDIEPEFRKPNCSPSNSAPPTNSRSS